MSQKTPLYNEHLEAGGVMVDFGGYELPVRYLKGIIAEHTAVREAAGIFDVSHMGEVIVEGAGATEYLETLLTNRFSDMACGKVRYSLMLYPDGGTVDDVLVYRRGEEKYLVVVNASNRLKDVGWMKEHASGGVKVEDISDSVALIALQGRNAEKILGGADLPEKYYTFKENVSLFGLKAMVSRTGYTGEDGFEIALPAENAVRMWKSLTEAGKEYGLCPAGLGARDTLRLEAAMPLYGHELRSDRLASEAGLDFAIKYGKPDFVGKKALQESEPAYHRTGAFLSDKGIAREGAPLFDENGEEVGEVTSGTMSPTLGRAIAMLRLKNSASGAIFTQIRGKTVGLELTALPFYKRK